MSRSKKYILIIAIVTALVILLATTFAWMTSNDTVTNVLETSLITDGSVVIEEVFEPPVDWKPGQEITKEVSVANNGSDSVLARIYYQEAMKLLQIPSDGDNTAGWKDGDTDVPQLFNAAAYQVEPWKTPTGAGLTTVNGLPTNAQLRVKKVVTNPGTPQERISYSFVGYYEIQDGIYAGKFQRMTATYKVSDTHDAVTVSDAGFWTFPGYTETAFDWKTGTPKPASTVVERAVTDTGNKIKINYDNLTAVQGGTPTGGEWWYSSADGFFYFMGKIDSGTITKPLMKSMLLENYDPATNNYAGMVFELTIQMEAIQNTRAAIEATDGWNISTGTPLHTELIKYCTS